MPEQTYQREQNGIRLDLQNGMITYLPPDLIQTGFAYLQNVRRTLMGRIMARSPLGNNLLSGPLTHAVSSLVRMNDASPVPPAPASGYVLIMGTGPPNAGQADLFIDTPPGTLIQVAGNLSGNPLSFVIFRPNASPQPWCYVADPSPYLQSMSGGGPAPSYVRLLNPVYPGSIAGAPITGMLKIRSDGRTYKMGIAEPQFQPNLVVQTGTNNYNWVMYRYVYRSSLTGALSNPSPESDAAVMLQSTVSGQTIAQSAPGSGLGNAGLIFNEGQYDAPAGSGYVYLETAAISDGPTSWIIQTGFGPTIGTTGLNIPKNTPVQGVQCTLFWSGQSGNGGQGILNGVSLYYLNEPIGTTKSPGLSNLRFTNCEGANGDPWGADGCPTVVGGPNDTWGASLSDSIVNDPSFGFGVQIDAITSHGTNRSFIIGFRLEVFYTPMTNGVSGNQSADPQVDKIDFYRFTAALDNFTYVGTVPNVPTQAPNPSEMLHDTLSDLAVAANPILEFDNFEPFPSIDLPRKGFVDVVRVNPASTTDLRSYIVWNSTGQPGQQNDPFNTRWLPGNTILIGGVGAQADVSTAYTLRSRPANNTIVATNTITDTTTGLQTFAYPPAASNVTYEISEPSLAAQASPVIWGPTAPNIGSFYFGLDSLNPGDLLWSKGNNFDSAPDTNRQYVTSPSEPLMNGVITSELNMVFSTERSWQITPTFADAVAAATGTEGQQWQLTQSGMTRGLYMRYAIAALGSMIAFRAKDAICLSMGGGQETTISDTIHNLFPHAGTIPQPVTIGGQTVYPPDDTRAHVQTMTMTPVYVFYNYQDTTGTPRTLVFDMEAKAWSVDAYNPAVTYHSWPTSGPDVTPQVPNQVAQLLVGCQDGTVRLLADGGTEVKPAILITKSENAGDARALKRVGDVFFRATIPVGEQVWLELWEAQLTSLMTGYTNHLSGEPEAGWNYIIDFSNPLTDTAGFQDVDDIAALLSWPVGSSIIIDLWQPGWIPLPEVVRDRPTDWDDAGTTGNKFVQGMLLELDTFGQAKTFQVQDDNGGLHTPVECPVTTNGQTVRSFTFNPPFQAHMIRIVSTDNVPWRFAPSGGWSMQWMAQPYPEASTDWTTEFSSYGLRGYIHCYQINLAYTSASPVTVTMVTDQGTFTQTYPAAGSAANSMPGKILLKMPRNKWKVCQFKITSATPVNVWKDLTEVWLKSWGDPGPYQILNPFGSETTAAAQV